MIGIFDSGTGGLTIAEKCIDVLDGEAILYLGDHGRAPYGHRSNQEIVAFTREAVTCLFDQGCDLVILACNTAAAVALRTLQQDWLPHYAPDKRILGILVPTVEAVTGVPWKEGLCLKNDGVIGVFATPKTVQSNAYMEEIYKRAPKMKIIQTACPGLVSAIEAGADEGAIMSLVAPAVDDMKRQSGAVLDAVLLGCTHYPLVAGYFKAALGKDIPIVSQPDITADALKSYLSRHRHFMKSDRVEHGVRFLTTGDVAQATKTASRLSTLNAVFEPIDLKPYAASSLSSAGATSPSIARK